ncbi:thiamine diphosphate-binding protein [Helicostylum pulchrum]|nr:thiamine diphosphate-binding protein [Helicostylum pulchrum]
MPSTLLNSVSIGQHILNRLKQLDIETIFGVPSDFNMPLLDLLEDDESLTWGNNANELNASYAADGYARVRGVGALITAFGVGELSAMNGIAGSYAERIPIIHIVGTPRTSYRNSNAIIHHTLGNGDYNVFYKMSSMISCASTNITVSNAVSEIDRVISTAVISKRPAYIGIPCDLINTLVQVPAHSQLCFTPSKSRARRLSKAYKLIIKEIHKAKYPVILADAGVIRLHLESEANAFIERSGFPTYVAPMGRGGVNAELANYRGVYCGILSLDGIQRELGHADLLIELGPVKSDGNTGNFTSALNCVKTISLYSNSTVIDYADYNSVCMHELLPMLTKGLPPIKKTFDLGPLIKPVAINHDSEEITCNYLWNKVEEYIKPNSIVVTETGSSGFAVFNAPYFKEATYINQILWASIGYSVPAALGASMAARHRQVYLFVGDGSFQITAQEISVFIRQGLTPVIFLLNNNGYVTEKLINGPHRDYNNFQMWEYSKALTFFGGNLATNKTKNPAEIGLQVQIKTRKAFETAMETVNQEPNKIHFLELIMPRFDAPRELFIMTKSAY